jgi:hypothetical protein
MSHMDHFFSLAAAPAEEAVAAEEAALSEDAVEKMVSAEAVVPMVLTEAAERAREFALGALSIRSSRQHEDG